MSDPGSQSERPVLLSPAAAAGYLGLTTRFLQNRRYTGDGPPFIRISTNTVRYRLSDLNEWIEARRQLSTSEEEVVK